MKNRKRIIVAFLCVAMLAVGVGYAAISDNLLVDGTMKYKTPAAVTGLVDAAVHFDPDFKEISLNYKVTGSDEEAPKPVPSDDVIQINNSFGVELDTLTSNVNINGIATANQTTVRHYHATAVYKIVYESEDLTTMDAPTVEISIASAGFQQGSAEGFEFKAALYDNEECSGDSTQIIKLELGQEAYVKVEYIYNLPENMQDKEVAGSYGLQMHVITVDAEG